jgi:hypothetical protein
VIATERGPYLTRAACIADGDLDVTPPYVATVEPIVDVENLQVPFCRK